MKLSEWRTLPKEERRLLWQRWSTAERLDMWQQFAATTPGWSLPYPADYNDPADSPLAFSQLALAVDAALTTLDQSKAPASHAHSQYAEKSYVDSSLAGKAPASHTHTYAQVGFKIGRFGVGSISGGGTATKTVAHGLGRTPTIAIGTAYADTGDQSGVVSVERMDGTNVVWKIGNLNSSANESLDVSWLVA